MVYSGKPLVSIALCTYNGEKFLKEQLDSLIKQDYRPIEIIAIDDCSQDSTFKLLQEYEQSFQFFKAYRNDNNLGFLKNFEKNLSICTGEYIAFCDQDDIWASNKLSLQIENIGASGLIYHDSELINELGESLSLRISDLINMYEGDSPLPFLLRNCVSGHAILVHRSMIERITPFQIGYHDWWSAYVAANINGIKYLDSCLVQYRQHESSSTKILKQSQENFFHPPLEYLQIFSRLKNHKNAILINKIYNFWRLYPTFQFALKDFFSLARNYKLFFFISKVNNRTKLLFLMKILLKKLRR